MLNPFRRANAPGPGGSILGRSTPGRFAMGRRYLAFLGAGAVGATLAAWRQPAQALTTTREIADMTWIEVRDAIRAGLRTVIVPSGGLEQNGPHMVIGKHDYIVRWAARRIAAELGDALVAPVVSYVPQGGYDPPTGNMQWPGTIGVPPEVFAAVLEGIARSLKDAGFQNICFIADHGPSIAPQAAAAARLTQEWGSGGPRVIAVDSYYADAAETAYLRSLGESDAAIGEHATIADTSELMAVHPEGVDLSRLKSSGGGLGVVGDPARSTIARGDAMMALKVRAAVAQISLATGRPDPSAALPSDAPQTATPGGAAATPSAG
jgi:creatinine amidohydrolase/Fe(II)-dependent formamide hydrolase-like protein